ncbi:hypothetical protein N8I77_000569 [Diaporthe amygdali]|uniref:ATP synthase subunit K, mitochondrial n=1 Tax=Phomopsis amygdali TaxID=1214568 RepID=A0AAD9SQ13_PHOAM|nr:uncharacterized protein J7T55_014559 [Diaporthe amygdali]KAJ0118106.1 hypothetical protein J7T55_014559 [Diaporthe amygdali]KAK2613674.1 hypothetical protein N8I77_000569 [Diaporthe amygdali]
MVQYYNVAGAKVGSHYLAMGVLAALFGGSKLALGGGSKATVKTPPINASSNEEADFIKQFMDQAEADSKKEKH